MQDFGGKDWRADVLPIVIGKGVSGGIKLPAILFLSELRFVGFKGLMEGVKKTFFLKSKKS